MNSVKWILLHLNCSETVAEQRSDVVRAWKQTSDLHVLHYNQNTIKQISQFTANWWKCLTFHRQELLLRRRADLALAWKWFQWTGERGGAGGGRGAVTARLHNYPSVLSGADFSLTEGLGQLLWKGWARLARFNCISLGLSPGAPPSADKSHQCLFYSPALQSLVISAAGFQSALLQYYFPLHLIIHNFHQSCWPIILLCWSIRATRTLNHNHGAGCWELFAKLELLLRRRVTHKGRETKKAAVTEGRRAARLLSSAGRRHAVRTTPDRFHSSVRRIPPPGLLTTQQHAKSTDSTPAHGHFSKGTKSRKWIIEYAFHLLKSWRKHLLDEREENILCLFNPSFQILILHVDHLPTSNQSLVLNPATHGTGVAGVT